MADLQHADCDGLGWIEGCFGVQGEDQADDDADGGDEAHRSDGDDQQGPAQTDGDVEVDGPPAAP